MDKRYGLLALTIMAAVCSNFMYLYQYLFTYEADWYVAADRSWSQVTALLVAWFIWQEPKKEN